MIINFKKNRYIARFKPAIFFLLKLTILLGIIK